MKLSTFQYKAVRWSQDRLFTDAVCWVILFLLVTGFHTIYLLWHQPMEGTQGFIDFVLRLPPGNTSAATWPQAFTVILWESALYTLALAIVVYTNLLLIKRHTLDRRQDRFWWRYSVYLLAVALMSILFALLFAQVATRMGQIRTHFNLPVNTLANFSFSMISTGLVYLKSLRERERAMYKMSLQNRRLRDALVETQSKLEDVKENLAGMTIGGDHIKIGNRTNYQIISFDQILFFKGEGNEPRLILANGKKPFAGGTLKEFEERLPSHQFIRVHRSYIINKEKIVARAGNLLMLEDTRMSHTFEIPISDSYLKAMEEDRHPYLNFDSPVKGQRTKGLYPLPKSEVRSA